MLERHDVSTTGACPAGTTITGPLLLYLQQAGVGGLTVEEAGTQTIPQTEPALFLQDNWKPTPNLTVKYGLRWEAQIEPDLITPPSEVFYRAASSASPGFPSDGTIPSDYKMWQPRLGISWDPKGDGKQVIRFSSGLFYSRRHGTNEARTHTPHVLLCPEWHSLRPSPSIHRSRYSRGSRRRRNCGSGCAVSTTRSRLRSSGVIRQMAL